MKEVNNDKRVLQVEIGNNVKKVDITGKDADDKVVMRQELSEDDLDQIAGGVTCARHQKRGYLHP